jgi:ankyrin repeat protein
MDAAASGRNVANAVYLFTCRRGLLDSAKAMVQAGCDPAAVDHEGQTALISAAENNQTNIVEWLLQGEDQMLEARGRTRVQLHGKPLQVTSGNKTAFLVSCQHGALHSVALLVGAGCDTAARCVEGRTGLILASIGMHTVVVEFLLQLPCFSNQSMLNASDWCVNCSIRTTDVAGGGMSAFLHACSGDHSNFQIKC